MVGVSTVLGWLERWSATAFLVAGGLLFVTVAIGALDAFTAVSAEDGVLLFVESLAGFGGMGLAFVALAGLYPRLADGAPRLAKGGVGLVALPATFVVTLLLCVTVVSFLDLPSPTEVLPSLAVVTGAVFLLAAVGITALGVASLRAETLPRAVGGSLFVFAAAWYLLFGAAVGYGPIPDWATVVTTGTMAVASVTLGESLRSDTDSEPVVPADPALDSAA